MKSSSPAPIESAQLDATFAALADPTRRAILSRLALGEASVMELAEPFACRCGAAACRGLIRGYRHLSPAQQRLLRPHLAPHLLDGGT